VTGHRVVWQVCWQVFFWREAFFFSPESRPGLPDFTFYNIPKRKIFFQMTIKSAKYTKWPKSTPTFTIARPFKIYPNCDFLVWNYVIWQPCIRLNCLLKPESETVSPSFARIRLIRTLSIIFLVKWLRLSQNAKFRIIVWRLCFGYIRLVRFRVARFFVTQ
jgi:hypothetical protein